MSMREMKLSQIFLQIGCLNIISLLLLLLLLSRHVK